MAEIVNLKLKFIVISQTFAVAFILDWIYFAKVGKFQKNRRHSSKILPNTDNLNKYNFKFGRIIKAMYDI